MNHLYTDRWGDTWYRKGFLYVVRLKDKNIGGWFNGIGLSLKRANKDKE